MTTTNQLPAPAPAPAPFSWAAPTDPQITAALADPLTDGPDVIADDCGHTTPWGLVVTTACGLRLCGDCASTHDATGCLPCDTDARACADADD